MRLALIAQELRIGSLVRPATSLHCKEVNQCDGGLRLLQGPQAASSGRTGHFIFVRPIRDAISLPSYLHLFITDAPLLGCACRDPFRMQHTWAVVACGGVHGWCQLLLRAPTQAVEPLQVSKAKVRYCIGRVSTSLCVHERAGRDIVQLSSHSGRGIVAQQCSRAAVVISKVRSRSRVSRCTATRTFFVS